MKIVGNYLSPSCAYKWFLLFSFIFGQTPQSPRIGIEKKLHFRATGRYYTHELFDFMKLL